MIIQYNQEYQELCLLISIGMAIRTHWSPMSFYLEGTSTVDESGADQLGNSQANEMLH